MGEVETNRGFGHQLTCLLNMVAQHLSQRRLQQVSGGVVALDVAAAFAVNRGYRLVADGIPGGSDHAQPAED